MRKYNICANLVRTIEHVFDKARRAYLINGSSFSLTHHLNIFLERIMSDAIEKYDGKVSTFGRNITYLRISDALDKEEQEIQK